MVEEKSDCTLLYNFLRNDTEDYSNHCCLNKLNEMIKCDEEGYITSFNNM